MSQKTADLLLAVLSAEPRSVQHLTSILRDQGHLRDRELKYAEAQVRTSLHRLRQKGLAGKKGTVEGRRAASPWGHDGAPHRVDAWILRPGAQTAVEEAAPPVPVTPRVCRLPGCTGRPRPGKVYCSQECGRKASRLYFTINPERRAAALKKGSAK